MHRFPNASITYSPQTPTALFDGTTSMCNLFRALGCRLVMFADFSLTAVLECQTSFICDAIQALRAQGVKTIELTLGAERAWKEKILGMVESVIPHPLSSLCARQADIQAVAPSTHTPTSGGTQAVSPGTRPKIRCTFAGSMSTRPNVAIR